MSVIDYATIAKLPEPDLGKGAFGTVYKATIPGHGVVAVKEWKPEVSISSDNLKSFQREVQVNQICSHPNIVKFIGLCTSPLCIIMEYVDGNNLYNLIHHKTDSQLTWKMVRDFALEMAKGIEHLHSKNVIHRDIKSLNVLIDKDHHVKICDFGLSRVADAIVQLTGGRGTVQWMAPEVIAHEDYKNAADIYSFGVVLWEMCARQVPFRGYPTQIAIGEAVLAGVRPPIPEYTPRDLGNLIRSCWDDNVTVRPTATKIRTLLSRPGVVPPELVDKEVPVFQRA